MRARRSLDSCTNAGSAAIGRVECRGRCDHDDHDFKKLSTKSVTCSATLSQQRRQLAQCHFLKFCDFSSHFLWSSRHYTVSRIFCYPERQGKRPARPRTASGRLVMVVTVRRLSHLSTLLGPPLWDSSRGSNYRIAGSRTPNCRTLLVRRNGRCCLTKEPQSNASF